MRSNLNASYSYFEACSYIDLGFELIQDLQDKDIQMWNPRVRYFLGDSSVMNMNIIEAILLYYSGLTFINLGQLESA